MADPEIIKEFESFGKTTETPEVTPQPTQQTPQQKAVEEFEVLVGGKPVKIPATTEFSFKHNGQLTKTPLEKLLNVFRQGTNFEEKGKELKALREAIEKDRGDVDTYKSMRDKFEALQTWSEQNPDQWERLHRLFQDREKALTEGQVEGGNVFSQELASLRNELKDLRDWKSKYDQDQQEARVAADTEAVKKDIEKFQADFKEIDLSEKDVDGYSLKSRIMKFGIDNEIPNFRTAALEYLHDRLADILVERGRTEAVKNVQKDTQQGILARSGQPFSSGQGTEVDPRKLSSSELKRLATQELEAMLKN